ncbi:MAG: hypothetical protein ACRCS8_05475 [Brevinema sp.]
MKYVLAFLMMFQTVNLMARGTSEANGSFDMDMAKQRVHSSRHGGHMMKGHHKNMPKELRTELMSIKEEFSIERLKLRNAEKRERMDLDTSRQNLREQMRSDESNPSLQTQMLQLDQKYFEIRSKYKRQMLDLEEKYEKKAFAVREAWVRNNSSK